MKEIYDWVPWFTELAQKIAAGGPQYLADRAKKVEWRNGGETQGLLKYGDKNIDPFSFFYTVAAKSTHYSRRKTAYPSISRAFDLPELADHDSEYTFIFPKPDNRNLLFHSKGAGNPELLWRLFRQAVNGVDSITDDDFDAALSIRQVGIPKLTQALFLINPHQFLPLDNSLHPLKVTKWPNNPRWAEYRTALSKFRQSFPRCAPYEINLFAWLLFDKKLNTEAPKHFQIVTKNDFKAQGSQERAHQDEVWKDFRSSNWIYTAPHDDEDRAIFASELRKASPGDVVLVRSGRNDGRGIGVVHKNDYLNDPNGKIHVLWLNTEPARLPGNAHVYAFSLAGEKTMSAFHAAKEYAPTFELLKRLGPDGGHGNGPNGGVADAKNLILFGPPGTGKTWKATRLALAIVRGVEAEEVEKEEGAQQEAESLRFGPGNSDGRIGMVTFHQNYSYEDFVEGIRPRLEGEGIAYELRQGIFRRMAEAAHKDPDSCYVLIIDEINRGNIAKILGELITLIEDSRRAGAEEETSVSLPYSGENFSVPDNLYIIGTMNTADRSIQLLDTALRRRFRFEELMPNPDHERVPDDIDGIINCRELMRAMNERITAHLDREHQIGHTNFFDIKSVKDLSDRFQHNIFPLLQEYFFDDWGKIRRVLNNNAFVSQSKASSLPADEGSYEEDSTIYERLPHADDRWKEPEQYKKIYASNKRQSEPPLASDS